MSGDSITLSGRRYEPAPVWAYLDAEDGIVLSLKDGACQYFVRAPLTWGEYVEWTDTTAIYPADRAAEYCALGLLSELGEVAGKLKKRIRDGEASVPVEAILAELGDACWYLARLRPEDDLGDLGEPATVQGGYAWVVGALSSALSEEYHLALEYVEGLIIELGYSLPEVLGMNVAKLESRKDRGTLGGAGDER